jgi:hypothetical protein
MQGYKTLLQDEERGETSAIKRHKTTKKPVVLEIVICMMCCNF